MQATPTCRFASYENSLVHFARAIYFLRFEEGKCSDATNLANCGFVDPHHVYQTPAADTYVIADSAMEVEGAIHSSYGIDLIELALEPSMKGKTLQLDFDGGADPDLEFHVELWKASHENTGLENWSLLIDEPAAFNGLGLIITRVDSHELIVSQGSYSLKLFAK